MNTADSIPTKITLRELQLGDVFGKAGGEEFTVITIGSDRTGEYLTAQSTRNGLTQKFSYGLAGVYDLYLIRRAGEPDPRTTAAPSTLSDAEKVEFQPWTPLTSPLTLKHIGKLGEECCELGAVLFRIVIQGVEGINPSNGERNRDWLTKEIGDVKANLELVIDHLSLVRDAIDAQAAKKTKQLKGWHGALSKMGPGELELLFLAAQGVEGVYMNEHALDQVIAQLPNPVDPQDRATVLARLNQR